MALRGRWLQQRLQLFDGADSAIGGRGIDFGTTVSGALLHGAGTSTTQLTTSTASSKFLSYYVACSATSGDARGMYMRLYVTGAGGGGESARLFTTVKDVAGATAHGAHISLNFGDTGSITGLGVAGRNTLHIANQAYTGLGGTYAAVQAEIYSDGANSDPAGMTKLSYFRVVNGGNASGIADVDDDAHLISFSGCTAASGNMIGGNTADECQLNFTNWVPIRIDIGGTTHYMVAAQTVAAVSS